MIALPIHDLPTRSASGFLIRYVVPRTAPPQLVGPLVRNPVFSLATVGDVIIGVGHGDPDTFSGDGDQVVMSVSSIPNVRGKVVFLVSCETALELGPAIIKSGADAFIGFKDDLVWIADADLVSRPWADEPAGLVMMPIVSCINSILDGETIGDSFNTMKEEMSANIEATDDELIEQCIRFNRSNSVLLGDAGTRITRRPPVRTPIAPPPLPPLIVYEVST
ncbi:MAG: hypothetical protein ACTSYX_05565 [Candidatus Thorarchaeota archaeon]